MGLPYDSVEISYLWKAGERERTEKRLTLQVTVHAHRSDLGSLFIVKRREVSGKKATTGRHDWQT